MNIKKKLQNLFKSFFYKIFSVFYGKINGKILADQDPRIKVKQVIKEGTINYKIFFIDNGRLYTDRIHDTAIILDDSIVEGPSYQLRPINNAAPEENIVFKKGTPRKKKFLNGTVLSLLTGGAGNDNYSHWLFDVLPRIGLCEEVFDVSKIDFFLLPSFQKRFQKDTLFLLNIDEKKCLSSKEFRHISTSKVIITDHPYCTSNNATRDITNIPKWISDWLKKKYLVDQRENKKYPSKIYIDRSDSESNTKHLRKILNEEDVVNLLKGRGFETVTLGKLNFKDQVQLFNQAKVIVGLHGAGFANISFCKINTKVIEFKNDADVKQYENLSKKNNLVYNSIISEPLKFNYKNQHGHIEVPLNKIFLNL